MKKALNIFTWVLLLVGISALVSFTKSQKSVQELQKISIRIDKPATSRFVTQEDIKNLYQNQGYLLNKQLVESVDIEELEQLLGNNSAIEKAQVYCSIDGTLTIEIKERAPIVRLYNNRNESFYLDQYGSLMPLSNKYSARVLIANGNINVPYSTVYQLENLEDRLNKIFRKKNTTAVENIDLLDKLNINKQEVPGAYQLKGFFEVAKFITTDKFWSAQISQVYMNEEQDLELIPRVGNHKIILGSFENIEQKFEKLLLFYKKGLNNTGWNNYSVINLKYKNQVVCTKR